MVATVSIGTGFRAQLYHVPPAISLFLQLFTSSTIIVQEGFNISSRLASDADLHSSQIAYTQTIHEIASSLARSSCSRKELKSAYDFFLVSHSCLNKILRAVDYCMFNVHSCVLLIRRNPA